MTLQLGLITLFPDMFNSLQYGITGRALRDNKVNLSYWNPRDFTTDGYQRVDDRPYGGGPGMLMLFQPLADAVAAAKKELGENTRVIHLSPQGQPLTQDAVAKLASQERLILVSSRYEGVDERFITTHVDEEYSVGDYVVSGGELPSMLLIDAMTRLLPGALGHTDSASQDSFADGLLDCPHYTRPDTIGSEKVPPVLLGGDHAAIARWRQQQSVIRTWQKRPDLLKRRSLTELEQQLLDEHRKTRPKECEE